MKKSDAEVSDLDVADLLKTEEDVKLFLEEAIGDAARSIGMAKIAESAGLNRESLYKALREDAHPRFDAIMRVLNAMGLKLCIIPCAVAEKKAMYKV